MKGSKRMVYALSPTLRGKDIKNIRKKFGFTQRELAELVNVSKKTIERWEAGEDGISGAAVPLLQIAVKYPGIIERMKIPAKIYPMRLWYMCGWEICTVIDVDEGKQELKIYNYTDQYQFRAFGREENPTFAQYEAFLEERCFPESRDKLKLMLKEWGLPFYDPLLIIERTEGRTAEDDFWIKIER